MRVQTVCYKINNKSPYQNKPKQNILEYQNVTVQNCIKRIPIKNQFITTYCQANKFYEYTPKLMIKITQNHTNS